MEGSLGEQFTPIDETVAVSVSKDLLEAYLIFTPAVGGRLLSATDIINILAEKKIIYGIDSATLTSLAGDSHKRYNIPIRIATGTPAVNGVDAKLDFKFNIVRDKTPKLLPDGTVDHRALNIVQNVHKGDVLAVITKETPGTPGKNVFGIEIKPKSGRPRVMPKGKNTDLTADKLTLIATADGTVEIMDGRITVSSLLEIKSDVGPATGHITFAGDVHVTGNVLSTYNVIAEGSVHIEGVIESSEVRAGGDITIAHGIKGGALAGAPANVYAGGNITSKFIENATVFAAGTIRTDSIIHSKVSSYDTILVWGRSGNIIGGKVRALRELICDTVGSHGAIMTAKTVVESGLTESLSENYIHLKEEAEKLAADIERFKKTVKELSHLQNHNAAQAKRLYTANKSLEEAEISFAAKSHELNLLTDVFEREYAGKITINKKLHPPVVMVIDKQTKIFEEGCSASAYRVVNHEIASVPI